MTQSMHPAFRLGDVRGIYPDDLDEAFSFRFAVAFARHFNIRKRIVTGRDMRHSSPSLHAALNNGFAALGIEVLDLGLCTTELGYFASTLDMEAAIIVTASHNPARYNGFKCVLRNGEAIAWGSGLAEVMALMREPLSASHAQAGEVKNLDIVPAYLEHLASVFPAESIQAGRIALNGLNGTATTLADRIARMFDLDITWFRREPGPIPEAGADPANPVLAAQMGQFMAGGDFSLGVAWDGDCDRCVFFDQGGTLVPTYYLIGILARHFLTRAPGRAIVFDAKLCWNTQDVIRDHNGVAVASPTGHAFLRQRMRQHNAIYGGELSSHHFFDDFFYCDSGMYVWLTVLQILANEDQPLWALIEPFRQRVQCMRELSIAIDDIPGVLALVETTFAKDAAHISKLDGLSMHMSEEWRFSVTPSKTEPLVRLNFEGRVGSEQLYGRALHVLEIITPYITGDSDPAARLKVM